MILCPSMMCASYANLEEEVHALEEAGTDIFHCDIMDGSFVPNISMGLMDVKAVRALTKKMVDVHLMIDHPADKIDWFLDAGADLIYIHPESEPQAMKTLMYIRSRGKLSGLAVNPDTSLSAVKELLPHCDYLLIMSVFPGFAGQTFIDSVDCDYFINTIVSKLLFIILFSAHGNTFSTMCQGDINTVLQTDTIFFLFHLFHTRCS